jgi:TonB family protein
MKRQVQPVYTEAAMRAKITGTVRIEAVVLPDGSIGAAHVVKSLDKESGLDDQALGTAREWEFEPCRLRGEPVPCLIAMVLEYRLH